MSSNNVYKKEVAFAYWQHARKTAKLRGENDDVADAVSHGFDCGVQWVISEIEKRGVQSVMDIIQEITVKK